MSVLFEVRKQIKENCANYTEAYGCTGCLIELDGSLVCRFFRDNAGNARCRYYEESVLPADPALSERYFGGDKRDMDRCDMCHRDYVKTSNRQRYCPSCRDRAETEGRRRRDARYRSKKTTVSTVNHVV